jgi:alkanesulfonate monooxygenase SsuD/methylene tetrahydromethanopterin reductase-like flavin-dependent oxidoreductase (luciferase family)
MGEFAGHEIRPVAGSAQQIADVLARFAAAGAAHVQLVVDPITEASIESLGEVLRLLDQM